MRIVFLQIVGEYGGHIRCLVEFAKRLSEHADVSIVDAYGTCDAFTQAVREAKLDYHVLVPGGKLGAIGRQRFRRVLNMPSVFFGILKLRARATALLHELNPTVVCSNDLRSAFSFGISRTLRHVPLVVQMHGWYTPEWLTFYTKWLARNRCAALLAVSHQTKTALTCSGIDPKKIYVLHNPIDVDETLALADREPEGPLPQVDRPVRLLIPAALRRMKGHHTVVGAMRHILDAGHDAVLWLAGDRADDEPDYVEKTQALAERIGVADRVEWLGLRGDVPQLMKAATIVIFPSHTEGHPRVTLEAMALEKPFASTPVGGLLDMVLPEVTGLLFDVDDEEGLARCVDRFVHDPQAAQRMAKAGQDYVRACFTPAKQIETAMSIFEKVIAQSEKC